MIKIVIRIFLSYYVRASHQPRFPDIDRLNFRLTECSAAMQTQCPIVLPFWRSPIRSKHDDRGHAVCNDSVLTASMTPR